MEIQIRTARELGKIGTGKYIEHACIDCGKIRWVMLRLGVPKNRRCKSCATKGKLNPSSKGKDNIDERGYKRLHLRPDDFFYPMSINKLSRCSYVLEHRLIMAKHLGRNLHTWEQVHHKNRNKSDNRLENLQLTSFEAHNPITVMQSKIDRLENRIRLLEEVIKNGSNKKLAI